MFGPQVRTTTIALDSKGHALHYVAVPCTYKAKPATARFIVFVRGGKIADIALDPVCEIALWKAELRARAKWHVSQSIKSEQERDYLRAADNIPDI